MERRSHDGTKRLRQGTRADAGMTLIETVLALTILFIATAGLMALAGVAIMTTENQGHLAARTAEYAQDKMEQLISLAFCNGGDGTNPAIAADTTQFPTFPANGTGLVVGGSADPNAPVAGYADYLAADGNLVPAVGGVPPPTWYYVRAWRIRAPSDPTDPTAGDCALPANYCNTPPPTACFVKEITVTSKVRFGVGAVQDTGLAQATITLMKTYPF